MTRMTLRLLLGIASACLVYRVTSDSPAQARTQIASPFGNAAIAAYVGSFDTAPGQVVIWVRVSDQACQNTIIGNGVGLFDDTELSGGSGDDFMSIISLSITVCGFKINAPFYNGHYLDLYGGAGKDVLTSYTGDSWLFGQDGNDRLTFNGFGNLFGGNGNDSVSSRGTFSTEGLYGEAGNDCVEDRNAQASVVDCGVGTDTLSTFGGTPISVNCETTSPNVCPLLPM